MRCLVRYNTDARVLVPNIIARTYTEGIIVAQTTMSEDS